MFFALWPDDGLCQRLADQARASQGIRLPASGYHMTLAFAGEVDASGRRALQEGAARVSVGAFRCVLDQVEYLGSGTVEALVSAHPPPALLALADRLAALVAASTGRTRGGPFRPHVSLARGSARRSPAPLAWPISWVVQAYVLCRSQGATGCYDVLERWPLRTEG